MDTSGSDIHPVERLADDFVERQRRGERPRIDEYIQRFPDLADEIREVFPALAIIERAAPKSDDVEIADTSPPVRQLGDYRILREIGRGGMGVVYEAEQQSLGRRVALKVLTREFSLTANRRRRFELEARAAARMHHTNIVPVFEVGHEQDTAFYAMQLIRGQSLDSVIKELRDLKSDDSAGKNRSNGLALSMVTGQYRCESLSNADMGESESDEPQSFLSYSKRSRWIDSNSALPGESDISTAESDRHAFHHSVAQIGMQTASALSYAHARGIIHRDIKPSNLLLDATGVVWVTDFGLAKTGDDGLTNSGDILGTLRYMSPERFQGSCDQRADIYAVGLSLYELLTLTPAFSTSDQMTIIRRIKEEEPPPPRTVDPRIPRDLETIILKAVDKDVKRRYQSADELKEDLRLFTNDEPIHARRISSLERLARWCRRNRALAASLGMVVGLITLIAIGSTITAGRLRKSTVTLNQTLGQLRVQKDKADRTAFENRRLAEGKRIEAENANAAKQETLRFLYAADMQLAGHVWQSPDGTAPKLRRILDNHIPQEDQDDFREFGWRYLWTQLEHSHTAFYVERRISSVRFDSEGRVVTLDSEGSIRYWDSFRQQELEQKRLTFADAHDITISPDASTIARVTAHPRQLRVVDLTTQRQKFAIELPVLTRFIGYSRKGRWLYVLGHDDVLRVFAANSGQHHGTHPVKILKYQTETIREIEISSDAKTLALANHPSNGRVTVLDLPSNTYTMVSGEEKASTIHDLAISASGHRVAYVDAEGKIGLWDVQHQRPLGQFVSELTDELIDVDFSPDGRFLAASASDGQVVIWDLEKRQQVARIKGHAAQVTSVEFSGDGSQLATCDERGWLKVWSTEEVSPDIVLAKEESADGVAMSDDGETIAVARRRGHPVTLYSARTGQLVREIALPGRATSSRTVAFAPNNTILAMGDEEGRVHLCDVSTEQMLRTLTVERDKQPECWHRPKDGSNCRIVSSISFSPDGQWLAAGFGSPTWIFGDATFDQIVAVWKVSSEKPARILTGHRDSIRTVAFSPDGTNLASASMDGTVRIWDATNWLEKVVLKGSPESRFSSMTFSPNGESLVVGDHDGSILHWHLGTRKKRRISAHARQVSALAFSPSGQTLASGSWDGMLKLWDFRAGRETLTLRDQTSWILRIAFNSRGDQLVSASNDGTVRLRRAWSLDSIDVKRAATPAIARARSHAANGRWEEAIAAYQSAISQKSGRIADANVHIELAECCSQIGGIDQAARDYVPAFGQLIESYPTKRENLCYELAGSSELCRQVLQMRPDDALLHFAYGHAMAKRALWGDAAAAFAKSGENGQEMLPYRVALCCVLLLGEDFDAYRAVVASAEDLPTEQTALHKSHSAASRCLRRDQVAVQLESEYPVDETQPRSGIETLRVQIFNEFIQGMVQLRNGEYENARQYFEEAISKNLGMGECEMLNSWGLCLANDYLGRTDDAWRQFNIAEEYLGQQDADVFSDGSVWNTVIWLYSLVLEREARKTLGDRPNRVEGRIVDQAHRIAIDIDPKILDAYTGRYWFSNGDEPYIDVTRQGQHLSVTRGDRALMDWYPESETTFFTRDDSEFRSFTFLTTGDGPAEALEITFKNGFRVRQPRQSGAPSGLRKPGAE